MPIHYSAFQFNGMYGEDAEEINRFIEECNLHRINGKKFCWIQIDVNGAPFIEINDPALKKDLTIKFKNAFGEAEDTPNPYNMLYHMLSDPNRHRSWQGIDYTWKSRPGFLNLFNPESWNALCSQFVYPVFNSDKIAHPLFDILLNSVSGSDKAFQAHLERCILRKLFFPKDYMIPAIVLRDPGRTGKQVLIENVLNTIFSGSQITRGVDRIFETHTNIGILGKIVVWANEADFTSRSYKKALSAVFSENIEVRGLGNEPLTAFNASWFIISGNDENPIIKITGKGNEERWSVKSFEYDKLHPRGLAYHIENSEAFAQSGAGSTNAYFINNQWVFKDREQISYWLSTLIMRHGYPKINERIEAFHGSDYLDDMRKSRGELEYLFDIILVTKVISSFKVSEITELYNRRSTVNLKEGAVGIALTNYIRKNNITCAGWTKRKSNTTIWDLEGVEITDDNKFDFARFTALEPMLNEMYREYALSLRDSKPLIMEKREWQTAEINQHLISEYGRETYNAWSETEYEEKFDAVLDMLRAILNENLPSNAPGVSIIKTPINEDSAIYSIVETLDNHSGNEAVIYEKDGVRKLVELEILDDGKAKVASVTEI